MTDEEKYLKLLAIHKEPPSLSFLKSVVKSHLSRVPYENISKIIRFNQVGPSIPSLEEFVNGIAEKTYGGTCFAQNIYLNHILNYLGFKSKLIGIRKDEVLSHLSIRVNIKDSNYFVDVGLMSSFSGPFRIHPSDSFNMNIGNQRFVFSPNSDLENYNLEIWRAGKMIRGFESSSMDNTEQDLETGIRKTFERSAMFMTTLCVHRVFETHSVGIWNDNLYRINGIEHSVRPIQNYSALKSVFNDELKLPQYPLDLTIDLLQANGAAKLFEVKKSPVIYAMTGGNGSGKTTYALKISEEKEAHFFSLDKTIKDFNQPIQSYEDYMSYFNQALNLMSTRANQALKEGKSVVFDFGGGISSREWLKQISKSSGAEINIFHLEVPLEERKRRIQQRNNEKNPNVYFFHMSDLEFDKHNKQDSPTPPSEDGIIVTRIKNG